MMRKTAHGFAARQKIIHDENAVALMEPLMGNDQSYLFIIGVAHYLARKQTALDIVALGFFGKQHRHAKFLRAHGGNGYAACLHRHNEIWLFFAEMRLEFTRKLAQKGNIHAMVDESVHLHYIAWQKPAFLQNAFLKSLQNEYLRFIAPSLI